MTSVFLVLLDAAVASDASIDGVVDRHMRVDLSVGSARLLSVTDGECRFGTPGGSEFGVTVPARTPSLDSDVLAPLLAASPSDDPGWIYRYVATRNPPSLLGVRVMGYYNFASPLVWSHFLTPSSDLHLSDAWEISGVFGSCNFSSAAAVWRRWLAQPLRERRVVLALLREWLVWTAHDLVATVGPGSADVSILGDCLKADCDALLEHVEAGGAFWDQPRSPLPGVIGTGR
jgi:hypothetical protein